MRIAYVANVRLPTEKAHGLQIMEMCRAFARAGHQVRLIVPKRKNIHAESPWEFYGLRQEFEIVEAPIYDFISHDHVLGRMALWLNTLQFLISARRAVNAFHPDVVYAREAWYGSLAPEVPHVFEAHDFTSRVTPMHRLWWKRVARIVAVTAGLKKAFVAQGVPEEKITVAHDGVDEATFVVRETKAEARAALGLPHDAFLAIYTGHLYPYKGADDLLEASASVDRRVHVVFVGGRPDDLARLKARARDLNLSNVTFTGQVPHARIPTYLRAADVAVLPTRGTDRHASEFLSPLKLFEYLAAGKALIATDLPSVREVLSADAATFVPPSDPAALAKALNALASAPERVSAFERESLRLASVHTWEKRAGAVLSGLANPRLAWHQRYRMELLIALLAFVLRAIYVIFFQQFSVEGGDGVIYLGLSDLVRGLRDHVPQAPTFYPIVYPYLLAGIRIVFGENLVWIRLVQALLSAGTVLVMSLMARRWINREAGLAVGLLGALYAPMILESGTIYTETTYTFFLTCAVGAGVLAMESKRGRHALLAGVTFVFAGLTRELAFYQAVLFAIWGAVTRHSRKIALLILLPTFLAFGGMAMRNAGIAKKLSLESQPLFSKQYEVALKEPTLARFLFAPDRWHLYLEGAYLYFRFPFRLNNLGSGVPIDGKPNPSGDVVYHFNVHELMARQPWPQVVTKITLVLMHWMLLALAFYGLWRGKMKREAKIGFMIVILFAFASIMFNGVHRIQGFEGMEPLARYRFPTDPIFIILAVAGAQALRFGRKR